MSPPPELEQLLAIFLVLWRGMAYGLPQQRVQDILTARPQREQGHRYIVRSYKLKSGEPVCVADAAQIDSNSNQESLAFTGLCEKFCYLLEGVVREAVQDVFGNQADVRWVACKARPVSVLLEEGSEDAGLPMHSVLQITLPDGRQYIFDGTITQYGISLDNWLLGKEEYLARFTIQPFEEVPENWAWRLESTVARSHNGYWQEAEKRLLWLTEQPLLWNFRHAPSSEITRLLQDHVLYWFQKGFEYNDLRRRR